jgi:hypothetical protein
MQVNADPQPCFKIVNLTFAELLIGPLKNPGSNWTVRCKIVQILILPFAKLSPKDPSLVSLVSALRSRQIVHHLWSVLTDDGCEPDEDDLPSVVLTVGLLLRLVLVDHVQLRQLSELLQGDVSRLRSWLLCADRPELQLLVLSLLNAVLSLDDVTVLAGCNDLPLKELLQSKSPEVVNKVLVTIGLLGRQASKTHCPALDNISDQVEILSNNYRNGPDSLRQCIRFATLHL